MNQKSTHLLLLFILGFWCHVLGGADCPVEMTFDDWANQSHHIFLGRVVSVTTLAGGETEFDMKERAHRFTMLWSWKGPDTGDIIYLENCIPNTGTCMSLNYGEVWLVFVTESSVEYCSPTVKLANRDARIDLLDEKYPDKAIGDEFDAILADAQQPLDSYLIQLFAEGYLHHEIDTIYQRGSQLYLLPAGIQSDPPVGTAGPVFVKDTVKIPYPAYAVLTTEEEPQESDEILYADGTFMQGYKVDTDDAWVWSYEFKSRIYLGNLPWVYVENMGYVYPADNQQIEETGGYPAYTMRWYYSPEAGWFYNVAKSYPLIVDESESLFFWYVEWGLPPGMVSSNI